MEGEKERRVFINFLVDILTRCNCLSLSLSIIMITISFFFFGFLSSIDIHFPIYFYVSKWVYKPLFLLYTHTVSVYLRCDNALVVVFFSREIYTEIYICSDEKGNESYGFLFLFAKKMS